VGPSAVVSVLFWPPQRLLCLLLYEAYPASHTNSLGPSLLQALKPSNPSSLSILKPDPPPQALTPQLTENKRKAEDLLREAYTLSECLQRRCTATILEKLLPKRYKQYQKGISGKA